MAIEITAINVIAWNGVARIRLVLLRVSIHFLAFPRYRSSGRIYIYIYARKEEKSGSRVVAIARSRIHLVSVLEADKKRGWILSFVDVKPFHDS